MFFAVARLHCKIFGAGHVRQDYARKLDELERLLNDPDVPMQPGLVWSLLDEISQRDAPSCGTIAKQG